MPESGSRKQLTDMDHMLSEKIIAEYAGDLPLEKKIIVLAEKVRDIPYGVIGSRTAEDVYLKNMGTCSGKHALLRELYLALDLKTQEFVAMHRFANLPVKFPEHIAEILKRSDIVDPHNFFKLFISDRWVTVDITWDKPLAKIGFPVTENWDGISDMPLCVVAGEIIETNNPGEIKEERLALLSDSIQKDRKLFLQLLSDFLSNRLENKP